MIQSAQTYHLKDLVRLGEQYFTESMYAKTLNYDADTALNFLRRCIIDATAEVVVAEWSGKVVGFGVAYLGEYPWCPGIRANVEFMYLLPDARGQGLFEGMLDYLIDWATRLGAQEIQAGDVGFNPNGVEAFLSRRGFEDPGVILRKMI